MTMTKDEIYAELKTTLITSFMIDEDAIKPEADLYTDLDFDSIDMIDLAGKIHSVTGRQLKPEQFKGVRTIADAVDIVDQLLRQD